jgi:transcription antitermination protein NusB
MSSRRRSRQRALQILFSWDTRREPVEDAINAYYDTLYSEEHPERDPFVAELVRGTIENLPELDQKIAHYAEHWRLERMPAVDRNILRLAVYEMTHGGTPAAVTIDEALELARKFSNEESVQFINGVLDAIHRASPVNAENGSGIAGP